MANSNGWKCLCLCQLFLWRSIHCHRFTSGMNASQAHKIKKAEVVLILRKSSRCASLSDDSIIWVKKKMFQQLKVKCGWDQGSISIFCFISFSWFLLCVPCQLSVFDKRSRMLLILKVLWYHWQQSVTFRFRNFSVSKLFHFFLWYRYRFRKFLVSKKVSVSVSEIFGIGQNIGIGFEFSNSKLCHFSSPLHPIHTDLFPQPSLSR